MGASEEAFRSLLRPTDEVKIILDAVLVSQPIAGIFSLEEQLDRRRARVLGVVTHKDDWALTEEGSLFICKYKSSDREIPEDLEVQRIYPIYAGFSIVMGQMRRGTLDLRQIATKSAADQPRSGISLTINPAEGLDGDSKPATYFTNDVQNLRVLVAECKRLKEISDKEITVLENISESTLHFSWIRPYLSKHISLSTIISRPPDLRIVTQPVFKTLSPASAGLPGDDAFDVDVIRKNWIYTQARKIACKGRRRLRLRLGTFNVNGKPPSQDLSSWVQSKQWNPELEPKQIPPLEKISPLSISDRNPLKFLFRDKTSEALEDKTLIPELVDPDPDPDLFVLGFQELDLSTEALLYSTSTAKEDAWCLAVFAALGEKAVQYEKLASKQLVGMLIVVLVKKSLSGCFSETKTAAAGAGILGVMGNKGGTAIRLAFTPPVNPENSEVKVSGSTSLTFANTHLAAFDEMVDKRNSDFQDLSRRLNFNTADGLQAPPQDESHSSEEHGNISANVVSTPLNVHESDVLFWMTDLNYRIDLPDTDVRNILSDEQWDNNIQTLLRYDQLRKSQQSMKAFTGFLENPITHMPSYRFSSGLMTDKLGYDLKRKPAWTDRILHLSGPTCQVNQVTYTSHPQITMSDHRPVAADFEIDVDYFDKEMFISAANKLHKQVDMLEELHERPSIRVDETYLDFGKVSYQNRTLRTLNLQNTGKTPCVYRFIPVQFDSPIYPEWLSVHPITGLLLPNEKQEIILTAFVDNVTTTKMNLQPKDLSGTLILHTMLGKDHFISVAGEYQYTCFANKLSTLTRLPGPIRDLSSSNALRPEGEAINAPREIMRLVNWMMTSNTRNSSIFAVPADEKIVNIIRECLDTGVDFPFSPTSSDPDVLIAFGETILRLLDSLVDPIVPVSLHTRCIQVTNRDEAWELLDEMPPPSVNVWISLTAFLHYTCQASEDSEKLASIFAPILLRDDFSLANPPVPPAGKRRFLHYFIT